MDGWACDTTLGPRLRPCGRRCAAIEGATPSRNLPFVGPRMRSVSATGSTSGRWRVSTGAPIWCSHVTVWLYSSMAAIGMVAQTTAQRQEPTPRTGGRRSTATATGIATLTSASHMQAGSSSASGSTRTHLMLQQSSPQSCESVVETLTALGRICRVLLTEVTARVAPGCWRTISRVAVLTSSHYSCRRHPAGSPRLGDLVRGRTSPAGERPTERRSHGPTGSSGSPWAPSPGRQNRRC